MRNLSKEFGKNKFNETDRKVKLKLCQRVLANFRRDAERHRQVVERERNKFGVKDKYYN